MSDFGDYINKGPIKAMAGVFGESWTRYSLSDGSIVARRVGGGRQEELQSGSGTTITAHLGGPLDGETVLNVSESDAVARGDVVVSPDSHKYLVQRPLDDAHTSWVVMRQNRPVA